MFTEHEWETTVAGQYGDVIVGVGRPLPPIPTFRHCRPLKKCLGCNSQTAQNGWYMSVEDEL